MQGNSNQQNFSVSIRSKREKFRAQIRRQQLQSYFRTKRIEHFSNQKPKNTIQLFKDLEKRIHISSLDSQQLRNIEVQVRKLFENNPEEQMNFYVLAILLLKCPLRFNNFKDLIIHQDNIIFHSTGNFLWCFGIYFAFWYQEIDMNSLQKNLISEVDQIDMFLAALIEAFYKNENFKVDQEILHCLEIYFVALKSILMLMKDEDFFPIFSFNAIIVQLYDVYKKINNQKEIFVRDQKLKMTELVNEITKNIQSGKIYISEKYELDNQAPAHINPKYILKAQTVKQFMRIASQILYQNIKQASDERTQCHKSILILSKTSAIIAGEFLYNERIIKELIFNMVNQKSQISISILKSFSHVIPALTKSKWITVLNESLHIYLITLLRSSLNQVHSSKNKEQRYSESLYQVLWLIELILHKSREMDASLYTRIFYQMENCGFGDLIDSMNHHRYDKPIEDLWSIILGKYFSSDMEEEEYQFNNENIGICMNMELNLNQRQDYQCQNMKVNQQYEI